MGRDQGSKTRRTVLLAYGGVALPGTTHTLTFDRRSLRLNRCVTDSVPSPANHSTLPDIHVAAVALIRDRRVLMVTARGRDVLFMPGGKIDAGETIADAAAREAHEEVSISLSPETLHELFTVVVQAHGEPEGRLVRMHVFGVDAAAAASVTPAPSAEVSELHWVTSSDVDRCPPAGAEVLQRLLAAGLID